MAVGLCIDRKNRDSGRKCALTAEELSLERKIKENMDLYRKSVRLLTEHFTVLDPRTT